jgi:hypothetical protein
MKFSLIKGDIKEFAIIDDNLPSDLEGLLVDNGIKAKLNTSEKVLALENTVKYALDDKILLKIVSVMYFKIEDSSWDKIISDGQIVFNKDTLRHFGIITIGATRGMLIAKCVNTPMSKVILPPMNIDKLLNQDITFSITQE